ncbi:MAG: hypothetical protein ACUVXI_05790 [bacterium]
MALTICVFSLALSQPAGRLPNIGEGTVTLPWSELKKLLEGQVAPPSPPEEPPVEYLIARANYTGTTRRGGDTERHVGRGEGELDRPGWAVLPPPQASRAVRALQRKRIRATLLASDYMAVRWTKPVPKAEKQKPLVYAEVASRLR